MPDYIPGYDEYLIRLIHEWSKALYMVGFILVPMFIVLDYFTMPQELLVRFFFWRVGVTVALVIQYFVVRITRPGSFSYFHGYFLTIVIGFMLAKMTVDLGGFDSRYYAGLNLVIIGIGILLPWHASHTAINGLIIIIMYLFLNISSAQDFQANNLINNLFFLSATLIISVSGNHIRNRLIMREFSLRIQLEKAWDSIWSEMEIAKRIQTALLPNVQNLDKYEIAASMYPAEEVGGDYYDILKDPLGKYWINIGDVSGHGVESGLIMMMTQTSAFSMINMNPDSNPSDVLNSVNRVINENIKRLGSERYMTISIIRLDEMEMVVSGKHQDILVYRAKEKKTEAIKTEGTWIGIIDNIKEYLTDKRIKVDIGDIVLLFTDGIVEAFNSANEMFSQTRLELLLTKYSHLSADDIVKKIINDVLDYQDSQEDDITVVAFKRIK
jgi:serine phosphatase RsbU (regulator of sigma subunit)